MEDQVTFHGKVNEPFELEIWMILVLVFLVYMFVWPKIRRRLQSDAKFISPDRLKQYLDDDVPMLLADVRLPSEFEGILGHIKSSVSIPLRQLDKKLDEMTGDVISLADTHVVVLGWSENEGYKGFKIFEKAGFEHIEVVDGGIRDWLRAGYDTERNGKIVDVDKTRDQLTGENSDNESGVDKTAKSDTDDDADKNAKKE